MDYPFETIATTVPDRNLFDLSYENRLTVPFGQLVPVYLQECLPGDTVMLNQELFLRFQPMLAPMYQRVDAYVHYFFVPNRLAYKDWAKFVVGGADGTDTEHFIMPHTHYGDIARSYSVQKETDIQDLSLPDMPCVPTHSLPDYLGIPTTEYHGQYAPNQYGNMQSAEIYLNGGTVPSGYIHLDMSNVGEVNATLDKVDINLIPFRDYQLIYDEYYRDENLISSEIYDDVLQTGTITNNGGYVPYLGTDSDELNSLLQLRWRAFRKDYFTSALPWAQKGPSVLLPLAGTAQITASTYLDWNGIDYTGRIQPAVNATTASGTALSLLALQAGTNTQTAGDMQLRTVGTVDIGSTNATTLNDFRIAIKTQEWLERNARAGSRYIETLLCHFGVMTPDARLQRPEYLTGCKIPVMISDVEQKSAGFDYQMTHKQKDEGKAEVNVTTDYQTTPLGYLAGKAIASDDSECNFKYYCYEHGYIMGILSIIPKAGYSQGLDKHWSRMDKFDYYWPTFAHLGEQTVKNKEIYLNLCEQETGYYDPSDHSWVGTSYDNDGDFGYQSRYCEYKCRTDQVHGDFKSNLDYWHMQRFFAEPPVLNQDFIEARPVNLDENLHIIDYGDFNRAFAVLDEWKDQILVDLYFNVKALRPIPRYSIPSF